MNSRYTTLMTRKVTDIKNKDIDNIYDPDKGCVNNALHFKSEFSKHTLTDSTDNCGVKN